MGAPKRFAELYLQYLSHEYPGQTRFIITRFRNVLGSNGSFLIRFAQQIREGGPVTVTHPRAERYLMTITEACQLVLQSAAASEGSEILSFDMGKPVRIVDIARKMIRLSGLEPETAIPILFTGLRPGEKLTEELDQEDSQITHFGQLAEACGFPVRQGNACSLPCRHREKALDSGQHEQMVAVIKTPYRITSVPTRLTRNWIRRTPGLCDYFSGIIPVVRIQCRHRPNHSSNDGVLG